MKRIIVLSCLLAAVLALTVAAPVRAESPSNQSVEQDRRFPGHHPGYGGHGYRPSRVPYSYIRPHAYPHYPAGGYHHPGYHPAGPYYRPHPPVPPCPYPVVQPWPHRPPRPGATVIFSWSYIQEYDRQR